jgi:predicted nucleic acid-binding protein
MKIIVDTNIVFSSLLNSNSRIGKILLNAKSHFQFFTCNYLKVEIQRHRNRLLKITKLTEAQLLELEELVTKHITFIDERLIPQDLLIRTEIQLKSIDPDDTVFVA